MMVLASEKFRSSLILAAYGLFCLLLGTDARAEGTQLNKAKAKSASSQWSTGLSVTTLMGQLATDHEEETQYSGTYRISLQGKIPSLNTSVSINLGYMATYTHRLEDNSTSDWTDPRWRVGYVLGSFGIFHDLTIGAGGAIALNKRTRETTMIGSIGPDISYVLGNDKISLMQQWQYRFVGYTYDMQLNGEMNSPHSFSLINSFGWSLIKNLKLAANAVLNYAIDYEGVDRSSTEFGPSVEWRIAKNFSATIGFSTRSGTLTPAGESHRINIYDPNQASGYLDLSLMF